MNTGRLPRFTAFGFVVMPLAALTLALTGCAGGDRAIANARSAPTLPTAQTVMTRCLERVATSGFAPPTESTLSATQWERYVSCKLAANMVVRTSRVADDPEATVSMQLGADGSVGTVTLLRSSGSEAWDEAVMRAIDAAAPFPAAPATLHVARVEMRFRPGPPQAGVEAIGGSNAGVGIAGESHWSVRHCTLVGGVNACD